MRQVSRRWLGVVELFESVVTVVLALLMAVVVGIATITLAWVLIRGILDAGTPAISVGALQDVFGAFLLVLVGLELLETIRSYVADREVRVEVVLAAALIAIARKVILLDMQAYDGLAILGLAALLAALAGAYYLLRVGRSQGGSAKMLAAPGTGPDGAEEAPDASL